MTSAERPWLLLIHQFPAKPGYSRVKLWRRLQRLGAVQLKNAVWGLPVNDDALEDFQWLLQEIRADGGDALICEASFIEGLQEHQLAALEYASTEGERRDRLEVVPSDDSERPPQEELQNRVWVTRQGVKADRIGSAWLIRHHIDRGATFKFVAPVGYVPRPDEVRFDMYEAEFTHEGDACTFEVLASTFAPGDPTIAAMGEVVHDIDFKEPRFGRPLTEGFRALLIDGVCQDGIPDDRRLTRGFNLFDSLWAALGGRGDPNTRG